MNKETLQKETEELELLNAQIDVEEMRDRLKRRRAAKEVRKRIDKIMARFQLSETETLVAMSFTGKPGCLKKTAEELGLSHCYVRQIIVRPRVRKCIVAQGHLGDDEILARIEGTIATRSDLQKMWTTMSTDPSVSEKGQLKASELLAKSEIMLVDKTVHEGGAVPLSLKLSKPSVKERIASLLGKDQEDDDDFLN